MKKLTHTISIEDWKAAGEERYGEDMINWKSICPLCKKISSGQEYKDAGAESNDIFQCCIGRFSEKTQSAMGTKKIKPTGCDFAAFGFFPLAPIRVIFPDKDKPVHAFDFADRPLMDEPD